MSSNGFIYINNLFLNILLLLLFNYGETVSFCKQTGSCEMLGIGLLKTGFWFCFLVLWLLLHLGSCKASVILLFESYYLVACMQAHLCNLGKIILVAEPPSSKEKWAFSSAHWWVHCQNFSPSSQKWACSQANYLGIKNLRLAKDNKMPGLK